MSWLQEIIDYLHHGQQKFREKEAESATAAELAFQSSVKSSEAVARGAVEVRTNTRFIREVLRGHV